MICTILNAKFMLSDRSEDPPHCVSGQSKVKITATLQLMEKYFSSGCLPFLI